MAAPMQDNYFWSKMAEPMTDEYYLVQDDDTHMVNRKYATSEIANI